VVPHPSESPSEGGGLVLRVWPHRPTAAVRTAIGVQLTGDSCEEPSVFQRHYESAGR
jgi:hypothetical protein